MSAPFGVTCAFTVALVDATEVALPVLALGGGTAAVTVSVTLDEAALKSVASVGVNAAERVTLPMLDMTVPAGGV